MKEKRYQIIFKKSAAKELEGIPTKPRQKIIDAIKLISINPYTELLQIKKLKGVDSLFRFRVGDYRVIYLLEEKYITITIIKIGHRQEVYKSLK